MSVKKGKRYRKEGVVYRENEVVDGDDDRCNSERRAESNPALNRRALWDALTSTFATSLPCLYLTFALSTT